jgi:hypothetical protein
MNRATSKESVIEGNSAEQIDPPALNRVGYNSNILPKVSSIFGIMFGRSEKRAASAFKMKRQKRNAKNNY